LPPNSSSRSDSSRLMIAGSPSSMNLVIGCEQICSIGQTTSGLKSRPVSVVKRSEEHTSELQSLTNIVCRLLLEKKKKTTTITYRVYTHQGPTRFIIQSKSPNTSTR